MAVDHFGEKSAMAIVAMFGLMVMTINFLYLHPLNSKQHSEKKNQYAGSFIQMWLEILKNYRNWLDCLMVVLLDTPVSIIGTLWGVVVLMDYYHFSDAVSAWIVMSLFAGLIIGLPIWGAIADRCNYSAWIIILGSSISFLIALLMLLFPGSSALVIASLFFGLGFFSSCQTLGFSWLIKDMRPELIGTNSAFNSMIFMGTNGGFKQIAAYLLISTPLIKGFSSSGNILALIAIGMFITLIYVCIRNKLFNNCTLKTKLAEG
jgi:predicted MFS family arabinose efflux permease